MGDARRRRAKGLPPRLKPQPEFVREYVKRFSEISINEVNPPRLYRYRSCATPYFAHELERMLLNNELFFPSQVQLNDPFDCQPIFEKGATQEEYVKQIHPVICAIRTEMARELDPVLDPDMWSPQLMCEMITRNIVSEPLSVVKHAYEVQLDKMIADMFGSIGLLSLTDDNNNVVLWSTYASRGNGICVELERLRFHVDGEYDIAPVQVRYTATRPSFDYWGAAALFLQMTIRAAQFVPTASQRWLLEALKQARFAWTKHERWHYEDEYRLIAYKAGGEYLDITPAQVSAIYIGSEIASDTKCTILSILGKRSRPIPVYIATMAKSSYAMTFNRIS